MTHATALHPYTAMLGARLRVLLQYRTAALAGMATQLFWGVMRCMIFTAFYASSNAAQPLTLPAVIDYVWLGQALLLLIPWGMDADVAQLIRSGNVACEMVRPADLYGLWYARALAMRLAPMVLRALPIAVIAALALGLRGPASAASGAAAALSLTCAFFLSAAFTMLLNVSLFWTVSGEGLARLMPALTWLLSGIVIPLPFFPDWLQPVLRALPFRGLLDVPFRLYVGQLAPSDAPWLLAHQVSWTVALILLGRWMLRRGLRRVVVQGG